MYRPGEGLYFWYANAKRNITLTVCDKQRKFICETRLQTENIFIKEVILDSGSFVHTEKNNRPVHPAFIILKKI